MKSRLKTVLKLTVALEVERGAKLLRDVAKGKRITQVESFEDTIVFAGTTHEEFVRISLASNVLKDAGLICMSRQML